MRVRILRWMDRREWPWWAFLGVVLGAAVLARWLG